MAIFWSNIASVDVTGIARRSASLWPDPWPDRVDISYGFGKGWVVNRATPVAFYVPKQLVGSALFPHYQIFWEPLIDGVFNDDKEYRNPTRTDLFNIGNPGAEMGKLRAREFQRAPIIGFEQRDERALKETSLETSICILMPEETQRSETVAATVRAVCNIRQPMIGRSVLVIVLVVVTPLGLSLPWKKRERVSGTWKSLGGDNPWLTDPSAQLKVSEPIDDPGFLHFEFKIVLPAVIQKDGVLGFGLKRVSNLLPPSEEQFPSDDSGGPAGDDVYTWGTLYIGSMPKQTKNYQSSENFLRLTGHPLPDRPRAFYIK